MSSQNSTMAQLLLSINVNAFGQDEVACSKVELSTESAQSNGFPVVIILGLPVSMTKREFEIYLEPFGVHVEGYCILCERMDYESIGNKHLISQYKKSALVFFPDNSSVCTFQELYSNMQLPSYSENAPSIVLHPGRILVDCSNVHGDYLPHSPSQMLLSSGSPQRAQSPFKKDYTDFWYQHGIQHLLQYRSSSKFVGKLPSSSHLRSLSSVEPCALPTCCVCLRRIREVSNLASGLNGASDLMVGRSYAGDAKLSLDELNTLSWHEDFKVVKDSKFAPEEENHLGVRCIVCHIYHAVATSRNNDVKSHRITEWQQQPSSNSNSTATTSMITSSSSGSSNSNGAHLGRCRTCNLSENIWVCLLCGHTGCGRYTSQHAKAHFQEYPSHHLSLELVSGRIWNYATDTFAYIEDESAHYISPVYSYSTQARLVASGQGVKAAADDGDDGECQGSVALTHQDYYRQGQASPSFTKKFILPSFLYPTSEDQNNSGSGRSGQLGRYPGHFATAGTGSELLSEESAASLGLDCVTTEKINALMGYYERLLEAQLLDQQLYFEKLLARETVRALESSYHSAEKEKETVSTAGNMAKKASSSKASLKVNEFNDAASASEEKTETTTTFLPESGMHINSPFLTRSNAFAEAQSELENEEVLRDMNEVETLKLEISGIEAEYQGILESMRAADDQVRLLKKENDVLIKSQKAKREKEAMLLQKAVELRQKCDAQIADMEQQISDLTFYTRTRKQLQESPLRDEIKGGTVVTKQKVPEPSVANSNNGGGGSAHKKGAGRKF